MIAYKFLAERSIGPFTGFGYVPGRWVSSRIDLVRGLGIHACRSSDLPYWVDTELWRIELDGDIHALETQVVGSRGRLVDRIEGWNARTQRDFAEACAERTRALTAAAIGAGRDATLADYAADAAHFASLGNVGATTYIAAVAGDAIDGSFVHERAWQAACLRDLLGLGSESNMAL